MIQVPKSHLEAFFLAIKGTEGVLSLPEARIRDPFFKQLTEVTAQFEQERKAVYEKYCNKDAEGAPETIDDQYKFENDVLELLNGELEILYAEEVALEVPEQLKNILEKTEYKPKAGEAEIIDEILNLL